jgi:hypothetical protein
MAKSIIDLDELKKFRETLLRVSGEMSSGRKRLSDSLTDARHFWADHQYEVSIAKMLPFFTAMAHFEKRAGEYIEWMDKKGAAGRKYLEGR